MSFFSRLFSAPETVSKTVDAAIKTGDALFFTDEEKSKADQKKLDWLLEFHKASSGSNVARRLLSLMFSTVFLFMVLVTMYLVLLGQTESAREVLMLISDTLVWPVGVIIVFYFGSGMVRDAVKK